MINTVRNWAFSAFAVFLFLGCERSVGPSEAKPTQIGALSGNVLIREVDYRYYLNYVKNAEGKLERGPLVLIPMREFKRFDPLVNFKGGIKVIISPKGSSDLEGEYNDGEVLMVDLINRRILRLSTLWPSSIADGEEDKVQKGRIEKFIQELKVP